MKNQLESHSEACFKEMDVPKNFPQKRKKKNCKFFALHFLNLSFYVKVVSPQLCVLPRFLPLL